MSKQLKFRHSVLRQTHLGSIFALVALLPYILVCIICYGNSRKYTLHHDHPVGITNYHLRISGPGPPPLAL